MKSLPPLLSKLAEYVGGQTDLAPLFRITALEINAVLGMDRTILFVPSEHGGALRAGPSAGFEKDISGLELEFPKELSNEGAILIGSRSSAPSAFITQMRTLFELASFVCCPSWVRARRSR